MSQKTTIDFVIGHNDSKKRFLLTSIIEMGKKIQVDHCWVCCDALERIKIPSRIEFTAVVRNYVKLNFDVGFSIYDIENIIIVR